MKILFIYKYCILGGVTTQLANRLAGFKDNIECHFAFLENHGGKVAFRDYLHVYILNNSDDLRMLIEKYNYEIVSIIDTNEVYGWLKPLNYKGFIINEVHTTTMNLKNISQLLSNKPMDIIITPSEYMKKIIEEDYGFKNKVPVEILPNCLDLTNFYDSKELKCIKEKKEIPILWVGKLDEHKRYLDFLKICNILETKYKSYSFKYIIVGGITAPKEKIDKLISYIIENKLISKITWYSSIDYNDMKKVYTFVKEHGGVYVSTTINESFGMSVLEAMTIGLPVVVPSVGALIELPFKNEYSLYKSGDIESACELITKQIGRIYDYDVEVYNISRIYHEFEQIIEKYMK